jgi:hypothetical protein
MSGAENLWYVKTPDGDVHRVTLDQLDEAFQAGRIDENVMVLAAGATKWAKLGELAGLDEPAPTPTTHVYTPMPPSLRPVSMDLSLDIDDENVFQKKSRKGLAVGVCLGILAVFGGILVANRSHFAGSFGSSNDSAAAAVAAPATPPPATPAAAPAPAPSPVAAAAPAPAATTQPADKLSEEQKAKLAAADKALEAKGKARKKNRAAASGAPHSAAKYKSQGFTTGGSKFDPLNASM